MSSISVNFVPRYEIYKILSISIENVNELSKYLPFGYNFDNVSYKYIFILQYDKLNQIINL